MVDIGAKTDYDAETETVIPRVDLTEQTAPAPGTLRLSMPVSSPGRVNSSLRVIWESYITLNSIETRRAETDYDNTETRMLN